MDSKLQRPQRQGPIGNISEMRISKEVKNTYNEVKYQIITGIGDEEKWVVPLLNDLTDDDVSKIDIHICTPGGDAYLGGHLLAAMRATRAEVNMVCGGRVCSAGTVLVFGGCPNTITVGDYTTFLFHVGWCRISGKSNDVQDTVIHSNKSSKEMFKDIYSNVLTEKEIDKILKGKELYLSSKKVKKRLSKKFLQEGNTFFLK